MPFSKHMRVSVCVLTAGLSTAALSMPAGAFAQAGTAANAAASQASADNFQTVDKRGSVARASEFAALRSKAGLSAVRVIAGLQTRFTPEGALSAAETSDQRAGIGQKTKELLTALQGTKHGVIHTYDTVPYVALSLTNAALDRLEKSGLAASVQEDEAVPAVLAQSGPLVEATESAVVGRSGLNQHIAILDTGVQKAHLFLQQANGTPKVVSEACYNNLPSCPGGASTAVGSGEPCTIADCDHGTHVAGIAAGRGTASSGVARDAKLIAIQVFSNVVGCGTCTFQSDQIAGLERVNALSASLAIASVNMSLGGGKSTTNCDADVRKPIIDTLRSKNIATAIAAGNDGFTDGVSFPSCISTAITVGSTTKTDTISGYNSSPLVELNAPGSSISSSIPDATVPRDAQASFSGTSMATPHVAGAWAVLKGITPSATVPTVLSALASTGKPVTDTRNNVTKPRIRVLTAGTRLLDTGVRVAYSASGTGVDMTTAGVGLRGIASSSITQSGIPAGATLISSRLIWTTIGGPDAVVSFNGVVRAGNLAGASKDSCWGINELGANRTYYANLPAPLGNGTYAISGVGVAGGGQAQGASLVTIYRRATGGVGRVYGRIGASTTTTGTEFASAPLYTTGNGVHVRRPAVHVAVGDGQTAGEDPLRLSAVGITAPDFFFGALGTYWDDDRIPISNSLVPGSVGSVPRTLDVKSAGDCLVMSHAAITYETTA